MNFTTLLSAAVLSATLVSPAAAEDLVFDLINNSSANLQEMYASPVGTDTWGDDILGAEVLASGENGAVTIMDGEATCAYDMRFVMDNGATLEGSADLCEMASFTLTD